MDQGLLPVPLPEDSGGAEKDQCRLWIGNLDPRITEFALLKILQKHGTLTKFDFLYHKSGPDQGKPRGYCFASFSSREEAENARRKLDGKLALSRKLAVKWAYTVDEDSSSSKKAADKKLDAQRDNQSPENTIRAIEAKLKSMEDSQHQFSLSLKPEAPPGSSRLSYLNREQREQTLKHQARTKTFRRNKRR
ncbi:hypothetical protein CHS0354_037559 [Potamilus streckersoni]|uniref:Probable RNA-binding protein 18 n=1 Tax=Potamilus streckersoni TaxID=2493646 RepID=A0AAE0SED1_9BIVA|nr:hypothetical protein CHS0354_037559 [Potamilus streckersoni]